jgi:cytochrome b561
MRFRLISWRLAALAMGLCGLFMATILPLLLSPRLLDPQWQLQISRTLSSQGVVALLGCALLHLAADLQPQSPRLTRLRSTMAALALPASLGFLLLIPLDGWALSQGPPGLDPGQVAEQRQAAQRINLLRRTILEAQTPIELKQRFDALSLPVIQERDLAQPLPQLRRSLLRQLQRTNEQVRHRYQHPPPPPWRQRFQEGVQLVLSALALALGFASLAQRRMAQEPLLMEFLRALTAPRDFSSSP